MNIYIYFQLNFTVQKMKNMQSQWSNSNKVGWKGQIPKVVHVLQAPFRLKKTQVFITSHFKITVDVHLSGSNKIFSRKTSIVSGITDLK